MPNVASPLAGLKVLDLSQIMAGPYCTMVLADLGAEVIKVEKAGQGDDSREMGPYVNGESASFAHINRNKKGIVINLKDPQGREVLYELARWADVVVENFRVGEGQHIDISLAECGLPWFIWEAAAYFTNGTVPRATGSRHRVSAPYQAFRTADGYIVIGAANQRTWERLCTGVLGRPDFIQDPRFATNSSRLAHVDELEALLEEEFAKAGAGSWIARCEESGVPCGPINDFAGAREDPHFLARGMIQEVQHPILGRMKMLGLPTKFPVRPARSIRLRRRWGRTPTRCCEGWACCRSGLWNCVQPELCNDD